METNRNKWLLWGGIALVAVLVIGGIAWWTYDNREASQEIAPGQTLFIPKEGGIAREFPTELILEKDVDVVKSYRIEYSGDNTSQPFAQYVSGKSFAENVDLFTRYFEENQWEMLRMGNAAESPTTFFHGAKDGNEANVILKEEDGRVGVSIVYTVNP